MPYIGTLRIAYRQNFNLRSLTKHTLETMITLTKINPTKKRTQREVMHVDASMIGKYVNQYLWSDVNPVGKVIGIQGKSTLICIKVTASENLTRLEDMGFEAGGFYGTYTMQRKQRYEFTEHPDEVFKLRYGKALSKKYFMHLVDAPSKFYDYNF